MIFTLTEDAPGWWRITNTIEPALSWRSPGTSEEVDAYLATHAVAWEKRLRAMAGERPPKLGRGEALRNAEQARRARGRVTA